MMRDNIFSRDQRLNRSKVLPAWKKMELIGMILAMAPGTTNIHKQPAVSANRTRCSMHMVPLVCSFILQHCNMDPATNLHVWSRTNAQKQLVKSARLVHLLRKSSALTFLQEMEIPESSVNAKAIVHIYLHPYKSASCFNYVTLKNNHSPEVSRRILQNIGKTTASLQELHVWTAEAVKHQRSISGVCAPGTLVQPGTGRAPSPRNEFAMVFQEQFKTSTLRAPLLCRYYATFSRALDYRFDMVIVGALLQAQVGSFRFQKQEFSQELTNMYKKYQKNAAESKYSGLKL